MRLRRRHIPGEYPDTFDQRLRDGRCTPGEIGQFVSPEYGFGSVGDGVSDWDWGLSELAGSLVLDLRSTDTIAAGTLTPSTGPALAVTGTATQGVTTPYRHRSGTAITALRLAASAYLKTAAHLDPPNDQLLVALLRPHSNAQGILASTFSGAAGGWQLDIPGTGNLRVYSFDGVNPSISSVAYSAGGWTLIVQRWNRDADQTLYLGSEQADSDALPGGDIGGGEVLSIGGSPAGAFATGLDIVRLTIWQGAAGFDEQVTEALRLSATEAMLGLAPCIGARGARYARAGLRTYYPLSPAGRVHVLGTNTPPAGHSEGLGADAAISSKTSQNMLYAAATFGLLLTDIDAGVATGLGPLAGADLTALRAVLPDVGDNVIAVSNATGVTKYLRLDSALGTTDPCWGSIRAQVISGAPVLGFQTAGGAFTAISAIVTGWARTYGTASPSAVTDKLAIEIPDGAAFLFCFNCEGVGDFVPDEVPSMGAAGTSATIAQGVLTLPTQPLAPRCWEADLLPRLWGGAAPTVGVDVLRHGADALVELDGAGNIVADDGTNTATATISEVDGVPETVRVSFDTPGLFIAAAGEDSDLAAFDGTIDTTLTVRGSPRAVTALRGYRNPRWSSE